MGNQARLLILSYYYLVTLYLTEGGEICKYGSDKCICSTTNVKYNLRPLMDSRGGSDFKVPGKEGYDYYFQPCNKILNPQKSSCAYNLVSCQVSTDETSAYGLGIIDKYTAEGTSDNFILENSYTDYDNVNRLLHLIIKCSDHEAVTFNGHSGVPPATVRYDITLLTQHVCNSTVITTTSVISVGTIIVIVFFVLIFVYLVGGVLFLKFARKAQGTEIIPNFEFWKGFPSLIKDGVLFTYGFCRRNSTYQQI